MGLFTQGELIVPVCAILPGQGGNSTCQVGCGGRGRGACSIGAARALLPLTRCGVQCGSRSARRGATAAALSSSPRVCVHGKSRQLCPADGSLNTTWAYLFVRLRCLFRTLMGTDRASGHRGTGSLSTSNSNSLGRVVQVLLLSKVLPSACRLPLRGSEMARSRELCASLRPGNCGSPLPLAPAILLQEGWLYSWGHLAWEMMAFLSTLLLRLPWLKAAGPAPRLSQCAALPGPLLSPPLGPSGSAVPRSRAEQRCLPWEPTETTHPGFLVKLASVFKPLPHAVNI